MSKRVFRSPQTSLSVTVGWDRDADMFFLEITRDGETRRESGRDLSLEGMREQVGAAGIEPPEAVWTGLKADRMCRSGLLFQDHSPEA